jgi:hypothetical protein
MRLQWILDTGYWILDAVLTVLKVALVPGTVAVTFPRLVMGSVHVKRAGWTDKRQTIVAKRQRKVMVS